MEKILVIDDDSAGSVICAVRSRQSGFELSVAGNGALAMDVTRFQQTRRRCLDQRFPGELQQRINSALATLIDNDCLAALTRGKRIRSTL